MWWLTRLYSDYLNWLFEQIEKAPVKALTVLWIVAIIATFAPAIWVPLFLLWPLGWLFVLPGLWHSDKSKQARDSHQMDQRNQIRKTQRLIELGSKRTDK